MTSSLFKNTPIFLAPLAGYTDQAYRMLCKAHGAEVLVSEMVSADGLTRDSVKTIQYIYFDSIERPYGVQLFGSNPNVMAKAAELVLSFLPDFIDINMGCPVKKVIRRGAGSALMQTPEIASSIVKAVKKAVAGALPISVKFRSGVDSNNLNYADFGLLMQDSGADFVCLHPRTAKQMFSGKSNWEHIKHLKSILSIPVVGNGDILCPEDALMMRDMCQCDGIMIGRGALGKPWIFSQARQMMDRGNYQAITKSSLLGTIMQHIDFALKYKPEHVVVKEMRSQLCFYTKGIIGGSELRNKINHTGSVSELKELLNNYLGGLV